MKKHIFVINNSLLCSLALTASLLGPLVLPAAACAAETEAGAGTEETESDTNALPADTADASVSVPDLIFSKSFLLESDNYTSIADGYYQTLLLSAESAQIYPGLSAGLAEVNKDIALSRDQAFKELADQAKENIEANGITDEDNSSAVLESDILPVRLDDKVLSFYTSLYTSLTGENAGATTYEGITLNVSDGSKVELDDVLADPENKSDLVSAINDNLRFVSTGESAGDREESVSVALASVDHFPTWVISENGVIFRFNPDSVGTVSEGALEAEIPFSEYPGLFTDAYGSHTGAYTLRVGTQYPVMADLNGDDISEKIALEALADEDGEEGYYTSLKVSVNGTECLHEAYFFLVSGVLLHTEEGKNYLYAETVTDNDYRITYVFDLSGETPVFKGELKGTGFSSTFRRDSEDSDRWYLDQQFISSPASFPLDTHMDLMSTYSATRRYKTGADGMPVALTDEYMINSDLELTSLTEIPAVTIRTEEGEVRQERSNFPKETKCTLYRTNGSDSVDVKTEDGVIYRFTVTEEWPQTVNGLRLDEAFDGTMFTS